MAHRTLRLTLKRIKELKKRIKDIKENPMSYSCNYIVVSPEEFQLFLDAAEHSLKVRNRNKPSY